MNKFLIASLALAGLAVAAPASAQGVYVDTPGVHFRVGESHHWRDRDDWRGRHHGWRAYGAGCRDVTIRTRRPNGTLVIRRIHRCG